MIKVKVTLEDGSWFEAEAGHIIGAEVYYKSKFYNGRSGKSPVKTIQEVKDNGKI